MARAVRVGALAAAAVSFVCPWSAHADDDPCRGNVNHVQPVGNFYVDIRGVADGFRLFDVWVYEETNGTAGLQRGGQVAGDTTIVDRCTESEFPDTIRF